MGGPPASTLGGRHGAHRLRIFGGDTVYLLHPLACALRRDRENLPMDAMLLGDAVAVEGRYISHVVGGAIGDGLRMQ